MPPLDLGKLLDFGYWTDANPPSPSGYFALALVLGLAGLALGLYVYYVYAGYAFRDHRYKLWFWRRVAGTAATIGGVIAFLALMRLVELPILSARILIYLALASAVGAIGYFGYYYKEHYPKRVARHDSWKLQQQYMPKPRRKVRAR